MSVVYEHPHCFSLSIGTTARVLSPNRARAPVTVFVVQADIANAGIITVGDSTVSATNGIQLDSGRAWVFAATSQSIIGSLYPTPMDYVERVEAARAAAAGGKQARGGIFLDLSEFFAIADLADQRLRVFWI